MNNIRGAGRAPGSGPLEVAAKDADLGFTVDGRHVTPPKQGFGRLWRNDYAADFGGTVSPGVLCENWKANFGDYWPKLGRFHPPRSYQIQPGVVAPLELGPNVGPSITTGVVVVGTEERSFTFMTPEGHMFAAVITFSTEAHADRTIARISILLRTSDPLYELAWPLLKAGRASSGPRHYAILPKRTAWRRSRCRTPPAAWIII